MLEFSAFFFGFFIGKTLQGKLKIVITSLLGSILIVLGFQIALKYNFKKPDPYKEIFSVFVAILLTAVSIRL